MHVHSDPLFLARLPQCRANSSRFTVFTIAWIFLDTPRMLIDSFNIYIFIMVRTAKFLHTPSSGHGFLTAIMHTHAMILYMAWNRAANPTTRMFLVKGKEMKNNQVTHIRMRRTSIETLHSEQPKLRFEPKTMEPWSSNATCCNFLIIAGVTFFCVCWFSMSLIREKIRFLEKRRLWWMFLSF